MLNRTGLKIYKNWVFLCGKICSGAIDKKFLIFLCDVCVKIITLKL